MRTKLFFTALAMVGCIAATAQSNRFSAGLELAMPMGDFADAANFGFGVSLGFELPVGDNLGVFANAGYITFGGTEQEVGVPGFASTKIETSSSAIPVQIGAKYYFMDNQEGFYAQVLVGIHAFSSTVTSSVSLLGQTVETEASDSNTNFSLAPGIGLMIGENIDLGLRYQLIFAEGVEVNATTGVVEETTVTNSYLGLRAAYMFGSR